MFHWKAALAMAQAGCADGPCEEGGTAAVFADCLLANASGRLQHALLTQPAMANDFTPAQPPLPLQRTAVHWLHRLHSPPAEAQPQTALDFGGGAPAPLVPQEAPPPCTGACTPCQHLAAAATQTHGALPRPWGYQMLRPTSWQICKCAGGPVHLQILGIAPGKVHAEDALPASNNSVSKTMVLLCAQTANLSVLPSSLFPVWPGNALYEWWPIFGTFLAACLFALTPAHAQAHVCLMSHHGLEAFLHPLAAWHNRPTLESNCALLIQLCALDPANAGQAGVQCRLAAAR